MSGVDSTRDSEGRENVLAVATFGHVDHGKTTLTVGLVNSSKAEENKRVSYGDIDRAPDEKKRGITISSTHVRYKSSIRWYSHIDCPGHADYIKNMITGTCQVDAAILVVDANDGVMPQTSEHLLLASQIGVKHVVVALNKCDTVDEEIIEFSTMDVIAACEQYGYKDVQVVPLSALAIVEGTDPDRYGATALKKLMDILDSIPDPERDEDGMPLMIVEKTEGISGRGTVATGRVLTGVFELQKDVSCLGYGLRVDSTCTGLETFRTPLEKAQAGVSVGMLLRGVKREEVRRGMVVVMREDAAKIPHVTIVKASLLVLSTKDGGRHTPFTSGYQSQCYCCTADVTCAIYFTEEGARKKDKNLPGEDAMVEPGSHKEVYLTFFTPVVFPDRRVTLRDSGKTVAIGTVLKDDPVECIYTTTVKSDG